MTAIIKRTVEPYDTANAKEVAEQGRLGRWVCRISRKIDFELPIEHNLLDAIDDDRATDEAVLDADYRAEFDGHIEFRIGVYAPSKRAAVEAAEEALLGWYVGMEPLYDGEVDPETLEPLQ